MTMIKVNGPHEVFEGSVFEALADSPQEAGELQMRAQIMIALKQWRQDKGLTQAAAAKVLGIDQSRVSQIEKGRIDLFSLDSLIKFAFVAGLKPELKLAA